MQGKKSSISKEQVLSTLQRLATELGRAPTRKELKQRGGISVRVVKRHFMRHQSPK
jgi:transcriptional regulator GlxA family with amidase domain